MTRFLSALACVLLASACSGGEPWRITDSTTTLGDDEEGSGESGPEISASATVSTTATTGSSSSGWETTPSTSEPVEGSTSSTSDTPTTTDMDSTTSSESGLESSTTGDPSGIDLSGWSIVQTESDRTFDIPKGTVVPEGGALVIGRDADQAAFETYWGVSFGDDVVYLGGDDQFPNINGLETYTLRDDSGVIVDGPTPALAAGDSLARVDPEDGSATGWESATADVGTPEPGTSIDPPAGFTGAFLSEVSDANGNGNFVYEFVELRAF